MGEQGDDVGIRGEMLIHLRNGIRQSSRLAEQLSADAIIGKQALGLLGRLQAIRAELDASTFRGADPRRAHNDPVWNEPTRRTTFD